MILHHPCADWRLIALVLARAAPISQAQQLRWAQRCTRRGSFAINGPHGV